MQREDPCALPSHYAVLGAEDRQVWQDRLCEMDSVEGRQLGRLHGELLAYNRLDRTPG